MGDLSAEKCGLVFFSLLTKPFHTKQHITFGLEMERIYPEDLVEQNILFSALNWGYGHVMRSLILLKRLQKQGNTIYIVATKEQKKLYEIEGIQSEFIEHEGYPFHFSGKGNFALDLFKNYPTLKNYKFKEHALVESLSDKLKINWVIADQSLGFFSVRVPSILITHQVNLPLKWWQKPAQSLYNRELENFKYIWIPDFEPPNNLAGYMSSTHRENASYIGLLSRFQGPIASEKGYDVGVLVTGPHPYDQQFFEQMCKRFSGTNKKVFIIYNSTELKIYQGIEVFQHLPTPEMAELLCSAELIISRSGYSSLMDFYTLNLTNLELHPTPGQQEQLYLKRRWYDLNKDRGLREVVNKL